MNNKLKKAIIDFIFENENEFQINNAVKKEFRPYIYKDNGQYIIGGEEVSEFITQAIKLITTK